MGVADRALSLVLGLGMRAVYRSLRLARLVTAPRLAGVIAIALTDERRIVLVRHRYNAGWHLPGGHAKIGEDLALTTERELREEIGLRSSSPPKLLETIRYRLDRTTYDTSVFLVDGIAYAPPSFSLEVAEVREFPLNALPPDLRLGPVDAAAIVARHVPTREAG